MAGHWSRVGWGHDDARMCVSVRDCTTLMRVQLRHGLYLNACVCVAVAELASTVAA